MIGHAHIVLLVHEIERTGQLRGGRCFGGGHEVAHRAPGRAQSEVPASTRASSEGEPLTLTPTSMTVLMSGYVVVLARLYGGYVLLYAHAVLAKFVYRSSSI